MSERTRSLRIVLEWARHHEPRSVEVARAAEELAAIEQQHETLRDTFAGQFMAARLANPMSRVDVTAEQMAQNAYARADAMLKAREVKP